MSNPKAVVIFNHQHIIVQCSHIQRQYLNLVVSQLDVQKCLINTSYALDLHSHTYIRYISPYYDTRLFWLAASYRYVAKTVMTVHTLVAS